MPVAVGASSLGGKGCALALDIGLDEPCWKDVASTLLPNEYAPTPGRAAAAITRFKVAYDDKAMYVLVECDDPQPADLRYTYSRRDKVAGDQDNVTVYVDPIGNKSFAQFFRVNPAGSITDGTFNEASGEEDTNQDFDFSVVTRVDSRGWVAEYKIPFHSIRYATSSGSPSTWTILVSRSWPRDQSYVFTSTKISKYSDCFLCANPELAELVPPADPSFVQLTPYVLGRLSHASEGAESQRTSLVQAGLDAKARLGASWFLDATLRPDFSQVEIDAPQLAANARFGINFPEKRSFFLEGADMLDNPTGLIYTRSVADPLWGARLTRRTSDVDALAIGAEDRGGGVIVYPGTFSAQTIERDVRAKILLARSRFQLAQGGMVGATASFRDSADGDRNAVAGADLSWQLDGQNKVRIEGDVSNTRRDASAIVAGNPSPREETGGSLFVDHSLYLDHFDSLLTYQRVSTNFRSENGFISQAGYQQAEADLTYRGEGVGWFTEVHPYLTIARNQSVEGEIVSSTIHPAVLFLGPHSTGLVFEFHDDGARADHALSLHRLRQGYVSLKTVPNEVVKLVRIDLELGQRLDYSSDLAGRGVRAVGQLNLALGRRILAEFQFNQERINGPTGSPLLVDSSGQLILTHSLNVYDWVRLIAQVRHTTEPANGLLTSPYDASGHTLSLVVGSRPWRSLELSVGATIVSDKKPPPLNRNSEVFLKLSSPFTL